MIFIAPAFAGWFSTLNNEMQKKTVSVAWENGKTPTFETTSAIAGIVLFSVYYSSIAFTTAWVTIGQLPSGYYPAEGLYLMSGLGAGKYMYISNTGVIMIKADSASSNAVASFNIAYAV